MRVKTVIDSNDGPSETSLKNVESSNKTADTADEPCVFVLEQVRSMPATEAIYATISC